MFNQTLKESIYIFLCFPVIIITPITVNTPPAICIDRGNKCNKKYATNKIMKLLTD